MHMPSMRDSETFEQTVQRKEQDRMNKFEDRQLGMNYQKGAISTREQTSRYYCSRDSDRF